MADPLSANPGTIAAILATVSTFTGASGLTFIEHAFEPRRGGRWRAVALALGIAGVATAVVSLLEACWLLRVATKLS